MGISWKPREGTYRIYVEVACIENDWPVYVIVVHVSKCDVLDITIADIWTCPSLETGAVL